MAASSLTILRWAGLAVLVTLELLAVQGFLTFPEIATQSGLAPKLIASINDNVSIGRTVAFMGTAIAMMSLMITRRAKAIWSDFLRQDGYRWWPWITGHAIGFLIFISLSWPVFGPAGGTPDLSMTWFAGWLLTGTFAVFSLLYAAAPAGTWLRLLQQEWSTAILATVAAFAAWTGGHLAQNLWPVLTEVTLWSTYHLLTFLYADVYIDPSKAILGVNTFLVEIAPACSGAEGIALITLFVALYLWLFRAQLRFPIALVLFPLGITVIWLINILRIVTLVSIGTSISPEIAVDGFHSQAGWLGFSIVALGVIALAHHAFLLTGSTHETTHHRQDVAIGSATSLLMPLLVLMTISMVVSALSSGFALLYPLTVVFSAATLWHYRTCYRPIFTTPSWQAIAIGGCVFIMWLLVVPNQPGVGTQMAARLSAMPAWMATGWIIFRILGSVLTVPIAEELAFRGYLLRKLVATDFENVAPGTFTWLSFVMSSVLFGLMHDNWVAGTLAGAGFAIALYQRGQVCDAVAAHITSNALIALVVLAAGKWELWG